jgi:hypothetical protein
MDSNRLRTAMLIGVAAAAGAFGAAAMMSTATAPTAGADAYTDIINAVEGDFTAGQGEFTHAFVEFGKSDPSQGLADLFSGANDDLISPGNNLFIGTVQALTNAPVAPLLQWAFAPVGNFSDGLSEAQAWFSVGESDLAAVATELSSGEYGNAAGSLALGFDYISIVPLEEILLGAAASR